MKKTLLVGLAIGMVSMVATSAFAGKSATMDIPAQGGVAAQKNQGGAGIVGSSHDLSNVGAGASNTGSSVGSAAANLAALKGVAANQDAQSRICVYCHHPHNSLATGVADPDSGKVVTYSPLWNRSMSAKTFGAYDNGGFEATGANSDKSHALQSYGKVLSGVSLLCMSCHDGVVAMNAYSQNSGSDLGKGLNDTDTNLVTSAGFGAKGGASNMSNHHPMGFNYATVQAKDNEIADKGTVMVPGQLVAGGLTKGFGSNANDVTIADLLDGTNGGTNMECVTCHDVHNTKNAPGAERFLWRSNNGSNFCLTCHLK